ncbi:5,6-dimethylbenzimidazole synthase [Methylomonas lenta]|uniref:5,6-dimethylbenzimidazole synthase n=1 Tax=Methylomonas lenta TaxID=980561 RepID=A0A177MYL3_9GAMM|nr:5,6-dimethylbenzimidazole synthase [Methylomonas lenta]OAI10787.1 5,6-dimethylbenzimidazole synthase [Methylomonas lenta]
MSQHRFNEQERIGVYRAIAERRDMRHFLPDPIEPELLARLLLAAHQAGSVGLMQPWRFIRITDKQLRTRIHDLVEQERRLTAIALKQRQDEFMQLKVEGILDCGELLVVALPDRREQHIFGRRTLPEMDLASAACAIQNIWLAARAEGLGMGWVSLFDPNSLAELLAMPEGSKPIAILCLGHVAEFYPKPMLEMENWISPQPLSAMVSENSWGNDA